MKSAWLILVLAGTALSSPAWAQVTSASNSTSGSVSGSNAAANVAPVNNGDSRSSSNSASQSSSGSTSISRGGSANSGAASQATNAGNSQSASTVVNNNTPANQTLRTAPAIVAPALTTTLTETCMGSSSVGVSVVGTGVTAGSTWNDGECVRRLNARELNSMGFHTEACFVLRVDKDVDNAFTRSGNRCDNWVSPGQASSGAAAAMPRWGSPPPAQAQGSSAPTS